MSESGTADSIRVVIDGSRRGSVLPATRAEMWRDLYLTTGADVRGGLWGNRLSVEGPAVRVDSSIYVRGEIRVRPAAEPLEKRRGVTFGSTITCGGTLLVEPAPFRTRVLSNVYAGAVNITNTVVYGNVYARNAIIRNSVVMGGVFCRDQLQAENSVIATFQVGRALLGKNTFLLFPIALSREHLAITHPVRAISFLKLAKASQAAPRGGTVTLGPDDVYVLDAPDGPLHALSVDQRIASGSEIARRFEENRAMAELVSLADHLPDVERKKMRGAALTEYERNLFAVLDASVIPEVQGGLALSDLLKRAEVIAGVAAFASAEIAARLVEEGIATTRHGADKMTFEGELPEEIKRLFRRASTSE